MILNTAWKDFLKKKASGIDCDLGQVQQVEAELIVTEKGMLNKKNLIAGFDGQTLFFRIMKAESKRFRQDDMKLRKVTKKIRQ